MTAKVKIDAASWQAGYDAGKTGRPSYPPPPNVDHLSWHSGYIEGQAKRQAPG